MNKSSISIFLVGLLGLLVGLVIGLGIFFFVTFRQPDLVARFFGPRKYEDSFVEDLLNEVENLRKQNESFKSSSAGKAKPQENTTPEDSYKVVLNEPLIVYRPSGVFSSSEKAVIEKKLINPYFDFNNDSSFNSFVMVISKNTPPVSGYYYSVTVIGKNNITNEFLYSLSNVDLDWWLPECLNGCAFSSEYEAKYPEIVAEFK